MTQQLDRRRVKLGTRYSLKESAEGQRDLEQPRDHGDECSTSAQRPLGKAGIITHRTLNDDDPAAATALNIKIVGHREPSLRSREAQ